MRNVRVTPIAPVARKQHICRERLVSAVSHALDMGAVDAGLVLVYPCGGVGTVWVSEGDVHALLGGVAVLQHRITEKIAACGTDPEATMRASPAYTPSRPEGGDSPEAIARFLAAAFGPDGVYGAGCWKCGQMAALAIDLLTAAGFTAVHTQFLTYNGEAHVYVYAQPGGWWVDPTIGQFNPQLPPFGRLPHPLAAGEEDS